MGEIHAKEMELARFGDGEADASVTEHLRWCDRCRSIVADYRWLQQEIACTLAAVATVPVPRPKWWAVQERMFVIQRRQAAGWRIFALASVVLAVCLMLSLSTVLRTSAVARTLLPEAVVTPVPGTAIVSSRGVVSMATPTPAISCEETAPLATPAFVLPPTPPETG